MSAIQMEALDFRYLLLEYYKKLNIRENELAVILMIDHLLEQKNTLITPDMLRNRMKLSTKEIDTIFAALMERGLITFETGKKIKCSLKPLQKKLYEQFQLSLAKEAETKASVEKTNELKNIYEVFETELNRPLSPLDYSIIGEWVDNGIPQDRIICALKEAISKNKKTIRSIDIILKHWQARDDIEETGVTAISEDWSKNIEETMKIAKAKWID